MMNETIERDVSEQSKLKKGVESSSRSSATRVTLIGAALAAIAASACCVLPAILGVVGVSGAGAATALEPFRPALLGLTATLVGAGFYLSYRKPRQQAAVDACECPAPRARRSGRMMLWLATVVVVSLAAYPYVAGALATNESQGTSEQTVASRQATLQVSGMSCESCVPHIVEALTALPGVVKATVEFDQEQATVIYDPSEIRPIELAATVSKLDGYKAEVVTN